MVKDQHAQDRPDRGQQAAGKQQPFGDAPGVHPGFSLVDAVEGKGD